MTRPLPARRPSPALSAYVVAALTACAALGAVALAPATATALDPAAASAATPAPAPAAPTFDPMRHLPADLITFSLIDLKALRAAPAWAALVAEVARAPMMGDALRPVKQMFGVDPLTDLDTVLITFRDSAGDHLTVAASLNKGKGEDILAVINSGSSPGGQLLPIPGQPSRYAAPDAFESREAVALLGPWFVLSSREELPTALDTPSADPTWAADVKAATAKGQAAFLFKMPPGESAEKLFGVRALQATLSADDALTLNLSATFSDEMKAQEAHLLISHTLQAVAADLSAAPAAADTLNALPKDLKRDGAQLQATVRLTPAQVSALVDALLVR